MASAGSVTIFNCTPYDLTISVNARPIEGTLAGMQGDLIASQAFPRVIESAGEAATFTDMNEMKASGDLVRAMAYRVPIPLDKYPILDAVYIFVFDGSALLVHNGRANPLNPA